MNKKHILFFNTAQKKKVLTLQTAKELGLKVSVVGQTCADWARPFIDRFIETDTNDIENALKTVAELHNVDPIDGIVTFWDRDVEPVATVADALHLPGSSVVGALRARNKYYMRERLREHEIPHPKFQRVADWEQLEKAAQDFVFPVIYKPVGAASSKGVFKIECLDDLRDGYEKMMKHAAPEKDIMFGFYPNEYLIEEYMEGSEVSVEGVVAKGVVHIAGITEKWTTKDSSFTEYQHAFPARLKNEVRCEIEQLVIRGINSLQLDDCGFHAEVMITSSGCKIIEINGRLGGGCITTHLVPLASGIDITRANILAVLGEPVELHPALRNGACIRFMLAEQEGIIERWENIETVKDMPGVIDFVVEKDVGAPVLLPPNSYGDNRLCYVITAGSCTDEAIVYAAKALETVRCEIR